MIVVSVFWLSPCPAPGIKESPSRTWASSWGSGTSGDVEIMLAEHLSIITTIVCTGDVNKNSFWKWALFVIRILLYYYRVLGFTMPRFYSTNTQIILARIEKLTSLVCLRWETGGFQLVGRSMGCKELHPIHATWSQQLFFYFDIKFEIKDMIKVSDVPENRVWFASKNLT